MTRICFAGITGWTASAIVPAIDRAEDLDLVAGVSRSAAGIAIRDAVPGLERTVGGIYGTVAEALAATSCDVLIDYTHASAVRGNVDTAIAAGVHAVIGSSGLTAADYDEIDVAARARNLGVLAAGNFSILSATLLRAATIAAQQLDSWEIIDYASAGKPDVPSGTSSELADRLGTVRRPTLGRSIEDLHGPREARGATVSGSQVHSVRLPGFVVSTQIVFGADGEKLTFHYDAGPSPDPYVAGTLLAARHVVGLVGVTRGLDALLF